MRTSVTLEEDIYTRASMYASARGITLGKAIGELIRRAEARSPAPPEIHRSVAGLAMFPPTGQRHTAQMVKDLENVLE